MAKYVPVQWFYGSTVFLMLRMMKVMGLEPLVHLIKKVLSTNAL